MSLLGSNCFSSSNPTNDVLVRDRYGLFGEYVDNKEVGGRAKLKGRVVVWRL